MFKKKREGRETFAFFLHYRLDLDVLQEEIKEMIEIVKINPYNIDITIKIGMVFKLNRQLELKCIWATRICPKEKKDAVKF